MTSALDPEAKRAYDAALALVTAKHCDKALDAFAAFLVKWPDHPYADNAMFWRGECYFQAGDYAHAAEQLEGVLARFPAGNKAPDALLKLGMAEAKLGNAAKAKDCFDRLLQLYPQSEAARRVPSVPSAPSTAARAAAARGPAPEDSR
jgi:tol-pal system protein YbgF